MPGALGDSDATGRRVTGQIGACADEPVAVHAEMCAPRGSQLFRSVMDDRLVAAARGYRVELLKQLSIGCGVETVRSLVARSS